MTKCKLSKSVLYDTELYEWNDLWILEQMTFSLRVVLGMAEVKDDLKVVKTTVNKNRNYHEGEQVLPLYSLRSVPSITVSTVSHH